MGREESRNYLKAQISDFAMYAKERKKDTVSINVCRSRHEYLRGMLEMAHVSGLITETEQESFNKELYLMYFPG